ncbi:DNA cytosine methyltransferase [Cohnella sp. AR92]|uniref:DNA cytosine methyltransferase n=1 Tax=Cohnella sp. AR92 TaxID=648716 RepID=UPI000F8F12C0|nr:DNA cytosine methyltransferase [Cohnella sp. AR92]RUS48858.1 DNA cytosine methyltransferase [Cohnella sp. AR92]
MYRLLDLFAGAGGMSLGFLQTKRFDIAVAVEKNDNAKATYERNHEHTTVLSDILDITDYKSFKSTYGEFDVVVGGPPCQGFSNANRQKNHIISQNNSLVKKYVEVILNLQPKAFVMENVRMLKSDVHRFYCTNNDGMEFERLGITTRNETIYLLDTECPVADVEEYLFNSKVLDELILSDKVFYLLRMLLKNSSKEESREKALKEKAKQCIKYIAGLPQRSSDVSKAYIEFEQEALNAFIKYAGEEIVFKEAVRPMMNYINFQRMLMHAKELLDNNIAVHSLKREPKSVQVEVRSYSVIDYINKRLGECYDIDADVLNAAWFGAPQLRERYIAMGILKKLNVKPELPKREFEETEYRTVYDAIKDLETVPPVFSTEDAPIQLADEFLETKLTSQLRNTSTLSNHIVTETRETAKKRFEALGQGQNFHDLDRSLIEDTYTSPERTQNSIYLRLNYEKSCGTVTNVRKSMWIHPTIHRAISIREAARLQSFPDDFVFIGTKDSQYQQVGNAVPPIMAHAIAAKLAKLLDACNVSSNLQGGIADGGYADDRATKQDDVEDKSQEYNARNDRQEVSA